MNSSGIYQIKNIINDKLYIGSALNLKRRWNDHKNELRQGKHKNKHLQSAWNRQQEQDFEFSVIEKVSDVTLLTAREQYYLDTFDVCKKGYNQCMIAGNHLGMKRSKQTCQNIANSLKGRPHSVQSKNNMRIGRLGMKLSKIHKAHIKESIIKFVASHPGVIGSTSLGMSGKKHTEAAKQKMRSARILYFQRLREVK